MTIVAIASPKGGAGRTTTALALAGALSRGKASAPERFADRRLTPTRPCGLVDLDPQAHLTAALNVTLDATQPGTSEWLAGKVSLSQVALPWPDGGRAEQPRDGWLVPARSDLVEAATAIARAPQGVEQLRQCLRAEGNRPEIILLDCPAGLGWLSLSALVAADGLVVPVPCQPWAVQSLGFLEEALVAVRDRLNPRLKLLGLVPTLAEARSPVSQAVLAELERWATRAATVCWPAVGRSSHFPAAALARQPWPEDPAAERAWSAYAPLAKHLLEL